MTSSILNRWKIVAYFKDYMGESFSGGEAINIPTKMIFMEDFIDDLTTA